jgi:hypothetical protein
MHRYAELLILSFAVASGTAVLAGCGGDGSDMRTSASEQATVAPLIEGATPAEESLFEGQRDVAALHDKDGNDAGYINLSNHIFWAKNFGFGQLDDEQNVLWGPAPRIPSDVLVKAEGNDSERVATRATHPRSHLEKFSIIVDTRFPEPIWISP